MNESLKGLEYIIGKTPEEKTQFKKDAFYYALGTFLSVGIGALLVILGSEHILFIFCTYIIISVICLAIKPIRPFAIGMMVGIFFNLYFLVTSIIGYLVNPPSW